MISRITCLPIAFVVVAAILALFPLGIAVNVGITVLFILAVIVLLVLEGWGGYESQDHHHRPSNKEARMKTGHFSPSYVLSRKRFRKAVRRAGGRLVSLELAAKGPKGEDLTIDIAWFGSQRPRRALVHSCGLHGVEAFAGSAIQLQWLKNGMSPIPEHAAVVLVHALNPYGMAWLRRFNENNVDLNRNFRDAGDYVPNPLPSWDPVNTLLNPPTPPDQDRFYLRAAWLVLRHFVPNLRQVVAGGQCLNPKGLFFGGQALEEGPSKFQDLMKERLADAECIVAIDVHSGLGRYAEDRLLVDSATERNDVNRTMREVFGERIELLDKTGVTYPVRGAQHDMYFRSFPRARVYFASQEFGTYNPLRVVGALRAENRWHFYDNHAIGRIRHPVKKALLEVFNPNDPAWRLAVLRRGEEVIHQARTLAFEPEAGQ